ncbi:MAG: protein kinase [Anaerolineae bacterium]|nr:protein kinase [Anaerolineae bacterium]
MSEMIGRELGAYRILEQIGVGGMSTVYKAYHAAMDRYVAVKVLPEQMSADPELRKRFEREAKTVARLEHAHILPVYDYGQASGRLYLAMRFVEAGTLKERIAGRLLPLVEANRILRQVGSALDYAHRLGVVHRDVKPSNVLIDSQGDCYLTDFGLARILETSARLTATGVGVGTPAYMSPEQGQGKAADARSDIYGLGVMLYEMVTGQVPYQAETPLAVVLQHITAPLPPPRSIRPELPDEVERVILKAMAKNPDDRFQTAREMTEAFDAAVRSAQQVEMAVPPPAAPFPVVPVVSEQAARPKWYQSRWVRIGGGIAAGIIVLAILFILFSRIPLKVQIAGGRLEVVQVVETPTPTQPIPAAATSTPLARAATATATTSAHTATPSIAPTHTPRQPTPAIFVTGTGCRIAYGLDGDIYVQDCDGGRVRRLADVPTHDAVPAWSPDGQTIAFSAESAIGAADRKLYLIDADGTNLRQLTVGEPDDTDPAWSPDGEWIAYMSGCNLRLIRPDGSDRHLLLDAADLFCAAQVSWSPDGQRIAFHSVTATPSEIWVVNRDGSDLHLVRSLETSIQGVGQAGWSPDGQQIAGWYDLGDVLRAFIINADGSGEIQITEGADIPWSWFPCYWPQWEGVPSAETTPAASPCRVAYLEDENVYVRNCDGSGVRQLTFLQSGGHWGSEALSWSPDGQFIVFQSAHERQPGNDPSLYLIQSDGSNLTRLTFGDHHDRFPMWSPDGRRIAMHRNCNLVTIAPDGSDEQVIVPSSNEMCPGTVAWSPDSRQLAFVSWHDPFPDDLNFILFVINSDGTNLRKLAKFEGGVVPAWSPDGKQIGIEEMGNAYLLNADGSGEMVEVESVPDAWYSQYWPQWDGETQTVQARAFAEPILAAIANRAPDVQDDFSDPESGWSVQSDSDGQMGYKDGEYMVQASPGKGTSGNRNLAYADFVVEFDARFVSGEGESSAWSLIFRNSPSQWRDRYQMLVNQSGQVGLLVDSADETGYWAIPFEKADLKPASETNHFLVIAQGPYIAIYVNGQPLGLAHDDRYGSGQLSFGASSNRQEVTTRVHFDNFKLWDIANLTQPPATATPTAQPTNTPTPSPADLARAFAEPILAAIANRTPDYEDEFDDPTSGWPTGATAGEDEWGYQEGAYAISSRGCIGVNLNQERYFSDFVLEVKGKFVSGDWGAWHVLFRDSPGTIAWPYLIHYGVGFYPNGGFRVWEHNDGEQINLMDEFGQATNFSQGFATNRLTLVVRGTRIAVYTNGEPAWIAEDTSSDQGKIQLGVCSSDASLLKVHFDDLKLWDISDLAPSAP